MFLSVLRRNLGKGTVLSGVYTVFSFLSSFLLSLKVISRWGVWYGMVWYDMVWHGMGMAWYSIVWYGMVWYGMVDVCEG